MQAMRFSRNDRQEGLTVFARSVSTAIQTMARCLNPTSRSANPAGSNIWIGLAVPANKVREALDRAVKYGEAQRIKERG